MFHFKLFQFFRSKNRYLWYLLLPLLFTVILRESGVVGQWDLWALDRLLMLRPLETMDKRIVIVTIDEDDLKQEIGKNSISDQNLAKAINLIAAAQPSVIGVDVIRDGNIDPTLQNAYQKHDNVIGLAKVLPPALILPPPGLDPERVGFGDYQPDVDSVVRRATLAIFHPDSPSPLAPEYSFAWQISRLYLQKQHQKIKITPARLELGTHSIRPSKTSASEQNSYFDILVNYRHVYPSFPEVKFRDVLANKLPELQNRIVVFGYTAATKQDFVNTSVVPSNPGKINGNISGVEYHAHIVSQLVTTTLNERILIASLPLWGDYLWILTCVVSGGFMMRIVKFKTPLWIFLAAMASYMIGVCLSIYFLFLAGWWLPIGLTFTLLIIDVPLVLFYQREQSLLAIAEKRRQTITDTFNAIHNGPLQELSLLMQAVKSENIYLPEINNRLEKINQQVRQVSKSLQIDATQEILVLGNGDRLDLNMPLNELFYLVSDRTLDSERYPSFSSLKMKIINFQEIPAESKLSIDHKRELCQFLEEAIGNVGKYAGSATRLQLLGQVEGTLYRLSIEDNGQGKISSRVGEGTKQAKQLAASLKGRFDRSQNIAAHGVICYLEWSFRRK